MSNLRKGKLVRIAGVEVGKVKNISINPDATVRVEFTADNSVILTEGTQAVICGTTTCSATATWRSRKGPGGSRHLVPVKRFRWPAPSPRWIWMR